MENNMEQFVITSLPFFILYAFIVTIAWTFINYYVSDGDGDCILSSIAIGLMWGIFSNVVNNDIDNKVGGKLVIQYFPAALAIFLIICILIDSKKLENKINYDYVLYAIPVLLTLTLFFL
jgi:hypothetical protein